MVAMSSAQLDTAAESFKAQQLTLQAQGDDPTACGAAWEHYRHTQLWANLYNAAWWALLAAAVAMLVVAFVIAGWLVLNWDGSGEVDDLLAGAGALAAIVGTVLTGKAAQEVKKAADVQEKLALSANKVCIKVCKTDALPS